MSNYTPNHNPNFWRNDNREIHESNCGSYALDVIEWYRPYDYDEEYGEDILREWDGCGTFKEALADSTWQHAKNILNEFSDIRLINGIEDANEDERVILYREGISFYGEVPDPDDICCEMSNDYEETNNDEDESHPWNWDFHFIWRDTEGIWHQKMGGGDVHIVEDPLMDCFWLSTFGIIYQGPIMIFAKKENKYEVA